MVSKLKEKEIQIKIGASEIRKCIDPLFKLKDFFYGDFKYNEDLGKVPDPRQRIQEAIECLEQAEKEASKIKVNSIWGKSKMSLDHCRIIHKKNKKFSIQLFDEEIEEANLLSAYYQMSYEQLFVHLVKEHLEKDFPSKRMEEFMR